MWLPPRVDGRQSGVCVDNDVPDDGSDGVERGIQRQTTVLGVLDDDE